MVTGAWNPGPLLLIFKQGRVLAPDPPAPDEKSPGTQHACHCDEEDDYHERRGGGWLGSGSRRSGGLRSERFMGF
jgi:hypothetical protein